MQLFGVDSAITCVAAGPNGCVFAGDTDGVVHCFARATTTTASNSSASVKEGEAAYGGDLDALALQWTTRATTHGAILSICAVADPLAANRGDTTANVLLVVGTASGELVFFRNETEARRLQLESAVLAICAHGSGTEFLAGDVLGTLYGVHQYGMLWQQERLGGDVLDDEHCDGATTLATAPPAFLFPGASEPTVCAIASVRVLDVEQTLSSYALVSTGRRHLLLTHGGSTFARIATTSPVMTIAAAAVASTATPGDKQSDVVLAAGEAGEVYQVQAVRDPTFRFRVDVFVEVGFPVAKLLALDSRTSDSAAVAWVCLGDHGELALFRGRELLRTWPSSPNATSRLVDIVVVRSAGATDDASLAIAFADRVELLRLSALLSS